MLVMIVEIPIVYRAGSANALGSRGAPQSGFGSSHPSATPSDFGKHPKVALGNAPKWLWETPQSGFGKSTF